MTCACWSAAEASYCQDTAQRKHTLGIACEAVAHSKSCTIFYPKNEANQKRHHHHTVSATASSRCLSLKVLRNGSVGFMHWRTVTAVIWWSSYGLLLLVADIVYVACWIGGTELEMQFNADDDILAARNWKLLTAGVTVAVVSPFDALAPSGCTGWSCSQRISNTILRRLNDESITRKNSTLRWICFIFGFTQ